MNKFWIFRIIIIFLALILIIRPELKRPEKGVEGKWAVLLDSSSSMEVKDPTRRMDQAISVLQKFGKSRLSEHLYQFDDGLRSLDKKQVAAIRGDGKQSNLAGALEKLAASGPIAGAVVVSDGRQVGAGDPVTAAAVVGKPLFLIGVGNRSGLKDAAVRRIQSPPFAFKNISTSLTAVVSASGYKGESLSVRLVEDDSVVVTQKIPVTDNDMETTVPFNWTPTSVGPKTLRVEVAPLPGEITTVNNRQEASVNVGRDHFRVLYICGAPGPEYQFLRTQFKSDPAVELVTFVILRNAGNMLNIPDQELSLIPFPTQEMLITQMQSFDLVVFEEFSFWEYGLSPALMHAVRKRVESGGAFLLLAGPKTLGPGSLYGQPDIQEIVPVEIGHTVDVSRAPATFLPRIANHPILRMEPNPEANRKIWSSLSALDDVLIGPEPRPGSIVVGEANVGNKAAPVLVVRPVQHGRTAVMLSRTTWRWSLVPGKSEAGEFTYQRFWKNMVLWLTRAEENKTVRIALEDRAARVGETALARVWVYDEYFKPLTDADVRVVMKSPSGEESELKTNREAAGVFSCAFTPTVSGEIRLQAFAKRGGSRYGEDATVVRVLEGHREEDDLRPDFATLQEMATVTGGAFTTADQLRPEFIEAFEKSALKVSSRTILIWNSPWLFSLIAALLVGEWILRKRSGLP